MPAYRHNLPLLRVTRLLFLPTVLLAGCTAENSSEHSSDVLSTEEIIQTFSNVKDVAHIQDAKGSTAINYWYANGTFSNEWKNATDSGTVTGTWYAENDKRCVRIVAGMESIKGQTRCGPIVRKNGVYKSFNADGTVHAEHTLTDIQ